MISSFTLKTIITKGTYRILGFSGFTVRGIVYEILKSIDPNLAENLHSLKRIAPLSTSPIIIEASRSRVLSEGSIFSFRISALTDDLSMKIVNYLTENMDLVLRVKDAEAKLIELSVSTLDPKRVLEEAKPC
jgi:CRISPR/Cas system endoribonuclease Cas6 (RAMP superfamily)